MSLFIINSLFLQYDKRGDPVIEEEYKRTETKCTFRRTFRDHTDLAPETAMFDTYSNDLWATRHAALGKFAQAARKVNKRCLRVPVKYMSRLPVKIGF